MLDFEWDLKKDLINQNKHKVSFSQARQAFLDKNRIIRPDISHSTTENRYFCFGKVDGGIVTVRFTYRNNKIRIFGAAYWREGKKIYDQENKI